MVHKWMIALEHSTAGVLLMHGAAVCFHSVFEGLQAVWLDSNLSWHVHMCSMLLNAIVGHGIYKLKFALEHGMFTSAQVGQEAVADRLPHWRC